MVTASVIFVVVYALIVTEKVQRTIAALLGAVIMIIFGFIIQEKAIDAIAYRDDGNGRDHQRHRSV